MNISFAGSSGRRSSGSRHVSSTTVTSSEAQQANAQANMQPGVPIPVSNASSLSVNAPPPAEGLVPTTGKQSNELFYSIFM